MLFLITESVIESKLALQHINLVQIKAGHTWRFHKKSKILNIYIHKQACFHVPCFRTEIQAFLPAKNVSSVIKIIQQG